MKKSSAQLLLLYTFLTLNSIFAQLWGEDTRNVTGVTSLYELCPHTDYCVKNATDKLKDKGKSPCCGSCSCADDCWERGNCCEDKQTITVGTPLETCESVSIKSDKKLNWGYYVIKSCPTEDSPLAKKCSGELKTSLEDSIWVTDTHTNKIYGNEHCALCNGIKDYSPWQLATDCIEAANGTNSPNEIVKTLMDTCSLTVESPSKEDHTDNICLIPEIMTCNATGQWKVYDHALEAACNRVQQPYIHEQTFVTRVYKSIQCFLCNSPKQAVSDECKPITYRSRTSSTKFVGLLDFYEVEKKTAAGAKANPVCAVDEIRDLFKKRCLKLSCPLLQTPVHGKCVRLFSSTQSLVVEALLLYNPVWVKAETPTEGYGFHFENLARNLSKIIARKLGRCKPCQDTVFAKYSNKPVAANGKIVPEWFSHNMLFYTTKRCQESLIVEGLNQLLGKEVELPFGTETIKLSISAATKAEYDLYMVYTANQMLAVSWACLFDSLSVDFQQLSSCPSVSLNFTDYTALIRSTKQMSKKRLIDSIFKQTAREGNNATNTGNEATNTGNAATNKGNAATDTDNFKVQVCFETYLSVIPKKSHGSSNGPMEIVLFVAVLISSKLWA